MAVTLAPLAGLPGTPTVPGSIRAIYLKVTFDASYPTGGYAITPTQLGFASQIVFIDPNIGDAAHLPVWNVATQKLQVFTAQGAEVANTTDIHTNFCYVQAFGY